MLLLIFKLKKQLINLKKIFKLKKESKNLLIILIFIYLFYFILINK